MVAKFRIFREKRSVQICGKNIFVNNTFKAAFTGVSIPFDNRAEIFIIPRICAPSVVLKADYVRAYFIVVQNNIAY